jgi:hypothetical protein
MQLVNPSDAVAASAGLVMNVAVSANDEHKANRLKAVVERIEVMSN